jgi:hypothetical protein
MGARRFHNYSDSDLGVRLNETFRFLFLFR